MDFEVDLSGNPVIDKYIDANFYKQYFAGLPDEKRQSFALFCKKCLTEFTKENLEAHEIQVLNFLLLRHYFML